MATLNRGNILLAKKRRMDNGEATNSVCHTKGPLVRKAGHLNLRSQCDGDYKHL